ncbi:Ankyrin repeat domain-containing protein 53, partial [Sciurus carolinensis]|nr:Ankyrin repeat domain-containing protein 53 [Sciurus carolinensis]
AAQPCSLPPHADSSTLELWEQRANGCYFELFAAAVGDVEWLRFCLNRKHWDIPTDNKGFAAIHFAAREGKLDCLQVLIEEYQFPVNLPTKNGQTPLHLVIHKDNKPVALPCIDYLLQKGAAINSKTKSGSTPLHLASREGMLSCVKFLVQNGANVHAKDGTGCKPIDYCKIWNCRACARFLKDAMWKRDKKDFACEMGKLKRLKDQLLIMEHDYLLECQKERQLLREDDFRKWLRSKLPCQFHSLVCDTKEEEADVPPLSTALSKIQKSQISMSFHPSLEGHLQNILQPVAPPKPSYKKPTIRRPTAWNISTNPATSPTTEIGSPQGIRLGVHPDPCQEHDFRDFLKVTPDPHGGAWLQTVDGHWVAPVPKLPYKVIVRVLYPGAQPFRMKVPQGLYPINILDVPKKRHFSEDTFQANALVMNLHETFDEAFLATIQAHQGLPALPSPQDSP